MRLVVCNMPDTICVSKYFIIFQVNIPLKSNSIVNKLENVPNVTFPVLWLEEVADLDDTNAKILKDMVITPVNALEGVQWTMVALGAAMMLTAIGFWVFMCII